MARSAWAVYNLPPPGSTSTGATNRQEKTMKKAHRKGTQRRKRRERELRRQKVAAPKAAKA
ncbi:MAG TPA: hypothetical protein VGB82_04510 [Alphaproteobacteria bacterium]